MAEKGLKSNAVGLFGGTRAILRARQPAFFRGETIIHESAHAHMAKHERLLK
jgi:hypothetical protein